MPKFIKTDRVAVSDDEGNIVYVRRTMNMGAALRMQEAAQSGGGLVAIYVQNILGWEGPDFKDRPCTPENIEAIDPDDPFWEKVGDKIGEMIKAQRAKQAGDSPLPSTTAGTPDTAVNGSKKTLTTSTSS